jgi:hypothetical protein
MRAFRCACSRLSARLAGDLWLISSPWRPQVLVAVGIILFATLAYVDPGARKNVHGGVCYANVDACTSVSDGR